MEHIAQDQDELELLYMQISSTNRVGYEAAIESLSFESYLKEIHASSEQFVEMADQILSCVDSYASRICLNTHIAEQFYSYAVDGIPAFLYRLHDGVKREVNESDFLDFGVDLSSFMAYNELFTCLEESRGGAAPAYSMMVVLNMFFARLKVDAVIYSDEEYFLSIPEVALLARMKEKSVRNFAHRSLGAQHDPSRRLTLIPARAAYLWLKDRRKFTPSTALNSEYAKRMLVSVAYDFA